MALQYVVPYLILAMAIGNEAAIDTLWDPMDLLTWPNRWYATRSPDPEPIPTHDIQDSNQIPNIFASLTSRRPETHRTPASAEGMTEDVPKPGVHQHLAPAPSPTRLHVSGKGKARAPRRAAMPVHRTKGKALDTGEAPAPGPLQPQEPYREPQAPSAIGAKEAPSAAPDMLTSLEALPAMQHKEQELPVAGPAPATPYVTEPEPALAPISQEVEAPQPNPIIAQEEVPAPMLNDAEPEKAHPLPVTAPEPAEPMLAPTQVEVGPLVSEEPLSPQAGPQALLPTFPEVALAPAPLVPDPVLPTVAPTPSMQPPFQQDNQPVILASGRQQDGPGFGLMKAVWQLLQTSQAGPLVLPGTGSVAGDSGTVLASQAPSGTAFSTRGT
jgi:hypothetical protein